MENILLYEQFRLIERSDSEINGAWKGAHLLLFFLAFVFGSFCTFCFHMLMFMFDEKCVLFPKLLALTSIHHSIIFQFKPSDGKELDFLPVDFLSTQWMEKSVCYLPTYVPLVSGIFGVVWTTIFLMCSTGSQVTGLQRPWRILPPVFVFSLVMFGVCTYSSVVTHNGLEELCLKLSEFTGSKTCAYTVNVATLAYERRIRGVFQAIRLTIFSAWLHTACWFLSAVIALARVLLVIDFQLVRITAELKGNVDKMLVCKAYFYKVFEAVLVISEHHETQIRTVSPDIWLKDETESKIKSNKVQFISKGVGTRTTEADDTVEKLSEIDDGTLFLSQLDTSQSHQSELALVPEEWQKVIGKGTIDREINYDGNLVQFVKDSQKHAPPFDSEQIAEKQLYIEQNIHDFLKDYLIKYLYNHLIIPKSGTSEPNEEKAKTLKKSNLKNRHVQTESHKDSQVNSHHVQISECEQGTSTSAETQNSTNQKADKETQIQNKEKKD